MTPHGWEVQLWPEALESAYPAELAPGPATSANDTTITIVDKRYVGQLPAEVLASLPEESVWIGTHSKSQPTLDLPLDLRDIMALLYANTREDWLSGTEPKIRIILADPYHVFRQGIRRYLDGLDDAEVVAEVSTPQAFRGAITQKNFDMVIVASDLLSGTHTTSPLNAGDLRLEQAQVVSGPLYPQPTIVLVADEDVEDYNVGLYDAPLPGNISKFVYIHRGAPVERLVVAIRVMTKSQEGT